MRNISCYYHERLSKQMEGLCKVLYFLNGNIMSEIGKRPQEDGTVAKRIKHGQMFQSETSKKHSIPIKTLPKFHV